MDSNLLQDNVQKYIQNALEEDVSRLALTKNPFPEIPFTEILNQIFCKQKAKFKLPTWFETPNIIYPEKISLEQTSSEKTAYYKANLISGENLIDLTGGFGVDDYYFSKKVNQLVHCELNEHLSELVNHNFKQLNVSNTSFYVGDRYDYLLHQNKKFNWIYIDPSRRNDAKGKVFLLKDCLPNVPELLDFYFTYSDNILIKTAPLLDIKAGLEELKNVKQIHIVAIDNEVKELLWILNKNYTNSVEIFSVNLKKETIENFSFTWNQISIVDYNLPLQYIFEPNAAIMKSGGFDAIANQYKLYKIHPNSHLYTSNEIIDFPGRIFEVEKTIPYQKTIVKLELEGTQANITTRNFSETVEQIRKKWKIKEGGNRYCFFTTNRYNDKIVLLCKKISNT